MKNGRIPEKMIAYLRPKQSLLTAGNPHSIWSFPIDERETPGYSKFDACQAFVVPADSEVFKRSAMKWACGGRCHTQIQSPEDVKMVEFDNKPFQSLRWVGVVHRSEGGVAYKVLTPEGWLVDLREDVVMECLFTGMIQHLDCHSQGSGTYFTGQFVWVVMGSQSRLVMVGSKVYQDILVSQTRQNKKNIAEKDLEIGGVYSTRKGANLILIGRGNGKGRKYLIHYVNSDIEDIQTVFDGVCGYLLNMPDVFPNWHYSNSFTVVEKVGQVTVAAGVMDAYEKKIEENLARVAAWRKQKAAGAI